MARRMQTPTLERNKMAAESPEKRPERRINVNLGSAIVASVLILIVGILIGQNWDNLASQFAPYLGFNTASNSSQNWSSLNEVYKELSAHYDGEVSDSEVIEYAKKGIAASVQDPYTEYMTASETTEFYKNLHGDVGSGIGIVIAKRENYVRIVRTLPDNPARRAGILAGDIIYKIDDEIVYNLDADAIATKLRGNSGSSVKVTVVRDNQELSFDLTREPINNVSAYVDYSGNTAIITITRFDTDTGKIVKDFVSEFEGKGINKVILDLRDNGGGYVSAAKDLISLWVDSEAILIQKSIKFPEEITYAAHGQAKLADMKTVVLVNGGTASASEIVAGALKDYNKATILGEKTYGKGVVQSLITLSGNTLLKVTTAHWYTPNGTSINGAGISPDTEVVRSYDDINSDKDPQLDAALAM